MQKFEFLVCIKNRPAGPQTIGCQSLTEDNGEVIIEFNKLKQVVIQSYLHFGKITLVWMWRADLQGSILETGRTFKRLNSNSGAIRGEDK